MSQMMPRSVYLISVKRSRWPAHCIAATMKASTKLMRLGRMSDIAAWRLSCVQEPDMQIERCQPAGQRLTRPAKLLKIAGHLVIAQVRVVAASRADDLILARVAAINMAVDHADGLRPENRGAVIVR